MTITNAAALQEYFDKVAEGYWPSNGFDYGYELPRATTEDGSELVLKPDTKAEWANNMCHGCGVLHIQEAGRDIRTGIHHLCLLVEKTTTDADKNPRVCSVEFALCGKCQMRAALVMQNSDHLVAGYDWNDMACQLYDMLEENPTWDMTLNERMEAGMTKGGMPSYFQQQQTV
jgi:hypothetical protein